MVLVCFGVFPLWIMNDLPNSSWFPPRPSMLNFPTLYRVCHLPGYFGWVDLDLERIAALLQVMNVNFLVCKSLPGSSPSPSSSSSRSLPMLIKLFLCHFFKAFILLNECWRVDFSNVGMIWSTPWCVRPWQSPQPVPFPWLCCWSTHSCCVQYFGKISFGCCLPAPWDCLIITWSSSGNNRARNHSNIWYSVYRL